MPAPHRRHVLMGLLATGLTPARSWADAGHPAYLSAAARPDGRHILCGISRTLDVLFQIPLPARGHAAATHPTQPLAVAFARRPGTFAVVIDCVTGQQTAHLTAPPGRHFYGHGAFSADGTRLYTTENDYEAGQGRIGVWDTDSGFRRLGDLSSGGIGPHDIKRLPGSDTLVVANGGIDTHPDTGRTKLNIPTMAPNLSYIRDGNIIETVTLPPELHKNSIRHLAIGPDGQVAFGMQWQGDRPSKTLVGTHLQGQTPRLFTTPKHQMQGYIGSIAFTANGAQFAATSPRSGTLQLYDAGTGQLANDHSIPDVCGIAPGPSGIITTAGTGHIAQLDQHTTQHPLAWDNHLIQL